MYFKVNSNRKERINSRFAYSELKHKEHNFGASGDFSKIPLQRGQYDRGDLVEGVRGGGGQPTEVKAQ